MFVVLEGWICRYKILPSGTRQIMAFLMPGDACDLHIKLLAEMDHSIQAVTPAIVAMVSRADMQAMMDGHRTSRARCTPRNSSTKASCVHGSSAWGGAARSSASRI